jgi:hypothetical protein
MTRSTGQSMVSASLKTLLAVILVAFLLLKAGEIRHVVEQWGPGSGSSGVATSDSHEGSHTSPQADFPMRATILTTPPQSNPKPEAVGTNDGKNPSSSPSHKGEPPRKDELSSVRHEAASKQSQTPVTMSIVTPALPEDVSSGKMETCFKSIVTQTLQPKEIVAVLSDTDDDMCKKMHELAGRVLPETIEFRANCTRGKLNQAESRNAAVLLATGDVCIFHDADDEMHFEKVELMTMLFTQIPGLQVCAQNICVCVCVCACVRS